MNELQIFKNEQFGEIRTITKNNEIMFVAADVCKALDLSNPSKAVSRLDEDERANLKLGRQGNTNVINEYGLYNLVLASRKPEAKAFKRWITHEVIPAIRKTGGYTISNSKKSVNSGKTKYYKGIAVITKRDLAQAIDMDAGNLQYYIKKINFLVKNLDYYVITGKDLFAFKHQYGMSNLCTWLTLITESGAIKICKMARKQFNPEMFQTIESERVKIEQPELFTNTLGATTQDKLLIVQKLLTTIEETLKIYKTWADDKRKNYILETLCLQATELKFRLNDIGRSESATMPAPLGITSDKRNKLDAGMREFCENLIKVPEEALEGIKKQFSGLLDEICCQETEPAKTARLALLAGIMLGARAEEYRIEISKTE